MCIKFFLLLLCFRDLKQHNRKISRGEYPKRQLQRNKEGGDDIDSQTSDEVRMIQNSKLSRLALSSMIIISKY